jgi:peptidoglycan/LPS O-acetylase OafA/YrhL
MGCVKVSKRSWEEYDAESPPTQVKVLLGGAALFAAFGAAFGWLVFPDSAVYGTSLAVFAFAAGCAFGLVRPPGRMSETQRDLSVGIGGLIGVSVFALESRIGQWVYLVPCVALLLSAYLATVAIKLTVYRRVLGSRS